MRSCHESEADLVIDGTWYKLERLGEIKLLRRVHGLRGIQFIDWAQSYTRLELEHKELLRQRRLAAKLEKEGRTPRR